MNRYEENPPGYDELPVSCDMVILDNPDFKTSGRYNQDQGWKGDKYSQDDYYEDDFEKSTTLNLSKKVPEQNLVNSSINSLFFQTLIMFSFCSYFFWVRNYL